DDAASGDRGGDDARNTHLTRRVFRDPAEAPGSLWLVRLVGRWKYLQRIRADRIRGICARPEVRRSLAVLDLVADRLEAVLQVGSDVPQLLIRHVAPRGPRHRGSQVPPGSPPASSRWRPAAR